MILFDSARKFYLLGLIALFGFSSDEANCQTPNKDYKAYKAALKDASDRGFERISKGVDNYPKHRDCFSCHHQAVPLLAYRLRSKLDHLERAIWGDQTERVHQVVEFSKKSLSKELAGLEPQEELGGRGMTLGYALWTMAMSDTDWGELGDQLVRKAVTTQQVDGRWRIHSIRPPAASSELMATTLVLFGLNHYLDGRETTITSKVSRASAEQARYKAMLWKASQPEPTDTEDLCASLWFDYLAQRVPSAIDTVGFPGLHGGLPGPSSESKGTSGKDEAEQNQVLTIEPKNQINHFLDDAQIDMLTRYYRRSDSSKLQHKLREMQNHDGGWSSRPGRESDAYSTATVLLILAQVDGEQKYLDFYNKTWYRNGLKYLLSTQKPDGSWHVSSRANPVQEFFDNGDPHETDQFISMQATAWAVAALSSAYHRHRWPLNVAKPPPGWAE